MAARITVERILRDDDDTSAQTVRDWVIEAADGFITIRLKHGTGFLLMRASDIDIFAADLRKARDAAVAVSIEEAV